MKQTIEVDWGLSTPIPDDAALRVLPDARQIFHKDRPETWQLVAWVVPKWQYPEWLGGAGVAMDEVGDWHLYYRQPEICGDEWLDTKDCDDKTTLFLGSFPLWTPPPCDDWRESWHPNPRA